MSKENTSSALATNSPHSRTNWSTLISRWFINTFINTLPSVLWHCWLGGRKGIRPVKNWVVGFWHGYLSGARCRLAHGPADATVSCFSKIQIGFTFLVPAHLGSPGQRAVKRVCVCMLSIHVSLHCVIALSTVRWSNINAKRSNYFTFTIFRVRCVDSVNQSCEWGIFLTCSQIRKHKIYFFCL